MIKRKYSLSKIIKMLTEVFEKFPGTGKRMASRFSYYLIQRDIKYYNRLISLLELLRDNIKECSTCFNLSESEPCPICRDKKRDETKLCIVETVKELNSIERSGEFRGRYHILKGVISPLAGVHPDKLTIHALQTRLKNNPRIIEIIIATNPNTEGEVTANYIKKLIKGSGVKITRIAYGVPVGSDLDFIDEVTLSKAIKGRLEF
ncbi:recombination protein RecR [Candidatus Dependentiae bacterium]|nr:recombination protein RecR [Candidatus Dependentiae bacterium]